MTDADAEVELATERNQRDNAGFWFKDITIREKEIALEYVQTGDTESLMRFILENTGARKAEYAGADLYKTNHPLFEIVPDLVLVLQVRLRWAARLVSRRIIQGENPSSIDLTTYSPEAFADYFNDQE